MLCWLRMCVWVCACVCTRVRLHVHVCACVRPHVMCVRVCAGTCRSHTAQPRGAGLWARDPQPDQVSPHPSGLLQEILPAVITLSTHPSPLGARAVRQLSQEVGVCGDRTVPELLL